MLDDTIAAIATPLGEGGLAVLRVSGANAIEVAAGCFKPIDSGAIPLDQAKSHTAHFGHIVRRGRVLDEVMVSLYRAPRTFTREDVIEISCHGGILPARGVLEALLENGARTAEPGEFTKRAFLNGRIDLTQAEAVLDIIHSRTELALSAAQEQLSGKLAQRINGVRDSMMHVLAHLEAHLDFPDEDIAPNTQSELIARLEAAIAATDQLLKTAREGQILRRGIRAAIIGRPNVGKSSLLNRLLDFDRAIVSPIPGTTRDTIEETAGIRGLPIVFIDTAGLRATTDAVETEGVRRSRETLMRADLILQVLDNSQPLTAEDNELLSEFAKKKRIILRNKSDLPAQLNFAPITDRCVPVSCATGDGIEALKDQIVEVVWGGEIRAEMLQVMINARHQNALLRTREATQRTLAALRENLGLEIAALELRLATSAIGEIVGKTTTEDLLDNIFGQFCIGK